MKPAVLWPTLLALGVAAPALAQTRLELKFPEGTRTIQSVAKTNQVLTIGGQEVPSASDRHVVEKITIGKRDADGRVPLRTTVETVKVDISLPGGLSINFDSAKPDPKSDVAELQTQIEVLRGLSGASYTVLVDKDQQVTAVQGVDKVLETAPQGAAAALKEALSLPTLKRAVAQEWAAIPNKVVNKGEKWQKTQVLDIGGGQTLTFENYYEYQGTVEKGGKTFDRISVFAGDVKYDLDPAADSPVKVVRSELKVDSSLGQVLFDREAGQIVESESTTHILGPMTLSINGMELAAKVDLTLEFSTKTMK